jgi:hypothetical protein
MKREREEQIIHDMKLAAVILGVLFLVIEKWWFA